MQIQGMLDLYNLLFSSDGVPTLAIVDRWQTPGRSIRLAYRLARETPGMGCYSRFYCGFLLDREADAVSRRRDFKPRRLEPNWC